MTTDSCERCGSPAPEALLRTVELRVDDSEVDSQTICPDCFSDWIAHYQDQMAGDMPGADAGRESLENDDGALSEAVRAAQEHVEADGVHTTEPTTSEQREPTTGSEPAGGDEIREVGGGTSPTADDGGVEVDLGAESDVTDEEEDDDGGLLLG